MSKQSWLVPAAIIIAGLLIAFGIFFARGGADPLPQGDPSFLRPVTPDDRLVGNPDAPVIVVEYSDIDCAYCKEFQATMSQLMADYAAGEQVAWAYRHFPLVNLHPYAAEHAEAAECVAELAGDAAFFRFIDSLHQIAPAGTEFNPDGYPDVVEGLGVSVADFEACRQSDRTVAKVAADFDNALESGASGTPYIVILVEGANPIPVSGALPYDAMKKVIEAALAKVR